MAQPPRFAARTAVIRDASLSFGARCLYIFLDDEAQGETKIAMRQQRLSVAIGLSARRSQLVALLKELRDAGYLAAEKTRHGNIYELTFARYSVQTIERYSVQGKHGIPCNHLYRQETQESPTPLLQENCPTCEGRGVISETVRGMGQARKCPDCRNLEEWRRQA